MSALLRQPDDPGIEYQPNPYAPLIMGRKAAEYSDQTVRILKKNSGRVPPLKIAAAFNWSLAKLRRVARRHGIDLRFPPEREQEPTGA